MNVECVFIENRLDVC